MLKGIDIQETKEYISQLDTGEQKTVFLIGNLTNRDKLRLFSNATNLEGVFDMRLVQDKSYDLVKAGLKGIRNLKGQDYDVITDAVIEQIPFQVFVEVVGKILEYNFSVEGIEKN